MQKPYIAIDIGSSSIKVIELVGDKTKELNTLGLELIPEGIITEEGISDDSSLAEVIKELFRKLNIAPFKRKVSISLNSTLTTVARVSLDTTTGNIEDLIPFVAEQYFQEDLANIYYKYQVLSKNVRNNPNCPVILVGVRRDVIDQRISLLNSVGVDIGVIDCDVFCLSNLLNYSLNLFGLSSIILNIGSESSQLILLKNDEYIYSKEIRLGSNSYTQNISNNMGISLENAEILKLSAALTGTEEVRNMINSMNEQLSVEVQDVISSFLHDSVDPFSNVSNTDIFNQVFIIGGGSKLYNIDTSLANILKKPVKRFNPFYKIKINPNKFDEKYLIDQGANYGVACGLALRSTKF